MLVGLIGSNISKSLSPALHEDAFAAAGMVGHYHLMDVSVLGGRRLDDLLAAARTAGFAGLNITHPFKEAVIALLDCLSPEAAETGAVNTVVIDKDGRTTGHNTDRSGFRHAFQEELGETSTRDKNVLLLGAGGAGRAVAFALMDMGAKLIKVRDIDTNRADNLCADLAASGLHAYASPLECYDRTNGTHSPVRASLGTHRQALTPESLLSRSAARPTQSARVERSKATPWRA